MAPVMDKVRLCYGWDQGILGLVLGLVKVMLG